RDLWRDHAFLSDRLAITGNVASERRMRLDHGRTRGGKSRQAQSSFLHDSSGSSAARCDSADPYLFHGQHGDLRLHHLVPDDPEARLWTFDSDGHAACSAPLRCYSHRDAGERLALGSPQGAALAYRLDALRWWILPGPDSAHSRASLASIRILR